MKNKNTLIIILIALALFLAGGFVRWQNQKQLLVEQEEEIKELQQEAQEIESADSPEEAETALDQIEIEKLDADFEAIDDDLGKL